MRTFVSAVLLLNALQSSMNKYKINFKQKKKKKKMNKQIKKSWFYIKHTDVSSLRFQSRTTVQGLELCLGL